MSASTNFRSQKRCMSQRRVWFKRPSPRRRNAVSHFANKTQKRKFALVGLREAHSSIGHDKENDQSSCHFAQQQKMPSRNTRMKTPQRMAKFEAKRNEPTGFVQRLGDRGRAKDQPFSECAFEASAANPLRSVRLDLDYSLRGDRSSRIHGTLRRTLQRVGGIVGTCMMSDSLTFRYETSFVLTSNRFAHGLFR